MTDPLKLSQEIVRKCAKGGRDADNLSSLDEMLAAAYISLHERMGKIAVKLDSLSHEKQCWSLLGRHPNAQCDCIVSRILALTKGPKE